MKEIRKAANLRLENPSKLHTHKSSKFKKSGDIEKVDLSNVCDRDEYSKTAPWDYKKLHRLHKSVNKGPTVPIISSMKKKPFCQEKAEQPRSLRRAINYPEVQTRRSSDYDSTGMDEFPSPSAILRTDKKCAGTLSTTVLDQSSDVLAFEDDFSDRELKILGENKVAEQIDSANIGLADAGIPDPTDVMDHDGRDEASACLEGLPKFATTKPAFDEMSLCKSDGPLFCATSSPEKIAPSPKKRKSTYAHETENLATCNESLTKRQKVSKMPSEQVLQPSGQVLRLPTAGQDQDIMPVQALGPIIQKSGRPRPDWVNEFDPEFIAEYADIVEFI